jgi:hypothetical protein
MNNFIGWLLKAYAVVAAFAVSLVVLMLIVLFWSGGLSRSRVDAAWQALRGRAPAVDRTVEPRRTDGIAEREQILEKREQELKKVDELTTTRLTLIRAEQETLEQKRREALAATAEAKKVQEENALAKTDAELAANVPILSRMEAPGIVSVLKAGDDARFVRYLRALRPGKAAEVLEALRTDPQFEDEFRRVPQDAPPGTKTRAERLNEEMKKS